MHPMLKQLIALQDLDNEIMFLEKRLKEMPRQIETSRSHLESEKESVSVARQEIDAQKKKRHQLEQQVQTETDNMAKAKVKQTSVKTNEEFRALKNEIDFIQEKIASIEDEELVMMESLEEKEKTFPEVEARFKVEEKKFQEFKRQKENHIENVKNDLQGLQGQRRGLAESIDPEWSKHYKKVAKMRGSNVVVPLVENQCQGCHQQIKPQLVIDVKIGEKVFECDRCNRILYWKPEEETETVAPE